MSGTASMASSRTFLLMWRNACQGTGDECLPCMTSDTPQLQKPHGPNSKTQQGFHVSHPCTLAACYDPATSTGNASMHVPPDFRVNLSTVFMLQVSSSSSLRWRCRMSSIRSNKLCKPSSPCHRGVTCPQSCCTLHIPLRTPMRLCHPPCTRLPPLASRQPPPMGPMTTLAVATPLGLSWRLRWLIWR